MASVTYTVPDSASDGTVDEFEGGYSDTNTFMFVGSPGASPPANYGMGFRFTGVTLTGADTVTAVQIRLIKDTTEWLTVNHRWTAINEDNTAAFSSGSPPGARAIVSASIAAEAVNVNHVNATAYLFPTTGGLQTTFAAAIQTVLNRAGFGGALAVVCQSDQDASAQLGYNRETYSTWDAAGANTEPQLVVTYTPGAAGGKQPVRRRAPMRVWSRVRYA